MKADPYASTRRSPTAHNEQRTGERRLAVLASIRSARNMGRVWNVVAVLLGTGIAAMLSGFTLWPPIVSTASVVTSFVIAIVLAWAGAMLLPKPAAGALWFVVPIGLGLVCAAILRHWSALGVLAGCIAIPLISLTVYQADARRQG